MLGLAAAVVAGCSAPALASGGELAARLPADAQILTSADMDGDGQVEVAASFQRLYAARIFQAEDELDAISGQWAADGERVRGIYTTDRAGGWRVIWEHRDPAWQPPSIPRVTTITGLADWAPMTRVRFEDLGGDGRQVAIVSRVWWRVIPHLSLVVLSFEGGAVRTLLDLPSVPNGTFRVADRAVIVEEAQIEAGGCGCTPVARLSAVYRLDHGGMRLVERSSRSWSWRLWTIGREV
jgi:hypothetical protein